MAKHGGNGYAADFDGENLGHLNTFKAFLEVLRYETHNIRVNLLIQEIVNLQDVARLNNAVAQYFLLYKIHDEWVKTFLLSAKLILFPE